MCVQSMIMDHYGDKWGDLFKQPTFTTYPMITPEEVAEFRTLLERAREYDKRHNEPECETEAKRQRLLAIAKELGVEISFV